MAASGSPCPPCLSLIPFCPRMVPRAHPGHQFANIRMWQHCLLRGTQKRCIAPRANVYKCQRAAGKPPPGSSTTLLHLLGGTGCLHSLWTHDVAKPRGSTVALPAIPGALAPTCGSFTHSSIGPSLVWVTRVPPTSLCVPSPWEW